MKRPVFNLLLTIMIGILILAAGVKVGVAENVDPDGDGSQYLYGENSGWLNAEPMGDGGPGIEIEGSKVTGYIWAENTGWISLSCENTSSCGSVDYGVVIDGTGNLSGYAWGENIGWISFSCETTGSCSTVDYRVTIDLDTGICSGKAWGENIGWINIGPFSSASGQPFSSLKFDVAALNSGNANGSGSDNTPGVNGCFIASAASVSPLEPNVRVIRKIRDRLFIGSAMCKALLSLYYRYSPPVADFIASKETSQLAVWYTLLPLVGVGWIVAKKPKRIRKMKRQREVILVFAIFTVFFATALFLPKLIRAGEMEPAGPPGSTMRTLDEIYDKLDEVEQLVPAPVPNNIPAPVEKTGQTTSYVVGDDGYLEKGVNWPIPRFTDNSDGTITDNLTGLIWLKNANCFGMRDWDSALSDCNGLATGSCGLTDGSGPGDWRLPNVKELSSLIHYGVNNPTLPNTSGAGRWAEDDPFSDVQSDYYWTSTTQWNLAGLEWYVDFSVGNIYWDDKSVSNYVWPVRGPQ